MGGIRVWADFNWFNLVQTAGIIGSLWFAAAAAVREAKAKEIENLLVIADHHRELWSKAYEQPELERIFQTNADIAAEPVTIVEEEFLNLVLVQYQITWCIAKAGGLVTEKELAADLRGFLARPLPRAVWEKTKSDRNSQFVWFVEKALRQPSKK